MGAFVRRLGFYLIAAVAAVTLDFFIPRMVPGDPVLTALGQMKGSLPPEAIKAHGAAVRGHARLSVVAVPALLAHVAAR